MTSTPCRGCNAPVYFVKDEKGTTQVLDARVHPIYALGTADGLGPADGLAHRVRGLHISHFVTCPARDRFKKETPERGGRG